MVKFALGKVFRGKKQSQQSSTQTEHSVLFDGAFLMRASVLAESYHRVQLFMLCHSVEQTIPHNQSLHTQTDITLCNYICLTDYYNCTWQVV